MRPNAKKKKKGTVAYVTQMSPNKTLQWEMPYIYKDTHHTDFAHGAMAV